MSRAVRRVSVVGNSGSGKSTLARLIATTLDVPYTELDHIHHLPGWQPIDPQKFMAAVTEISAGDGWVIDGNYRTVVVDGPVWQRADTIVWLDLPRRTVMRQIVARTARRVTTRQDLWNGNRERLRDALALWDPDRSVVRWAWTNHAKYTDRFTSAATDPRFAHATFVRLRGHEAAEQWVAGLREAQ